ncbi:hypothetical protein BD626DRAFT_511317 [Schizophyllum amplum]|uniref:Uncharacterized protein n=1 Tax=Schizophyllum amplum TaxID=97359 RepID=A0A550C169_9AGAR|nr:hypothetical protein BD626DRAFT_511317 [Auriculariopsis ampla]
MAQPEACPLPPHNQRHLSPSPPPPRNGLLHKSAKSVPFSIGLPPLARCSTSLGLPPPSRPTMSPRNAHEATSRTPALVVVVAPVVSQTISCTTAPLHVLRRAPVVPRLPLVVDYSDSRRSACLVPFARIPCLTSIACPRSPIVLAHPLSSLTPCPPPRSALGPQVQFLASYVASALCVLASAICPPFDEPSRPRPTSPSPLLAQPSCPHLTKYPLLGAMLRLPRRVWSTTP